MKNEGRTKKLLKNTVLAASYQVVNMACGMITPRFILLAYGSSINGLVSSIVQFLSCFTILEAGLAMAAQQSLYKPLAEKNWTKVSEIVSAARIAYNQVGYWFTALSIILAFLYPVFAGTEELSYGLMVALVIVLAMNSVLSYLTIAKYQVLFQADQKLYIISIAKIITRVLNTICIVLMCTLRAHILLLRIVVTSSVVVQALIISVYAKKNYSNINYKAEPDNSALKQRWDALFLQFLGAIQISSPGIILTIFASLKHVSIYSVYNMVFSALMNLLAIFMNGINASFGNLLQSTDTKKLQSVYSEFENAYYVLITIIYTVTAILIVPFIRIYTADILDTNYLLPGIGVLFVVNAFAYNLKTPQGMMVQAAGLFSRTRKQNTIQALILLVGGLIFGYFWGIYGVLVASILSNLYRCVDLVVFIPRNVTKAPIWSTTRKIIIMLVTSISLILISHYVLQDVVINNYMQWFITAIVVFVCVACAICIMDFIFERQNLLRFLKRIFSIIRRRSNVC